MAWQRMVVSQSVLEKTSRAEKPRVPATALLGLFSWYSPSPDYPSFCRLHAPGLSPRYLSYLVLPLRFSPFSLYFYHSQAHHSRYALPSLKESNFPEDPSTLRHSRCCNPKVLHSCSCLYKINDSGSWLSLLFCFCLCLTLPDTSTQSFSYLQRCSSSPAYLSEASQALAVVSPQNSQEYQ